MVSDASFWNLFESCISNRENYVTYNGIFSSKQRIYCGVPQGPTYGGLLFSIHINDACLVCKHNSAIYYYLPMIQIYSQVEKILQF